jgi:hypothetical protein
MVPDPDAAFSRAVTVGAVEVTAVHEEHGFRSGRVSDPFGYDREFSRPLDSRTEGGLPPEQGTLDPQDGGGGCRSGG